jgi:hypothetical protein
MLIMTSERCPQCDALLWIRIDGKKHRHHIPTERDAEYIVYDGHGLAANVYLDRDGVLCVTQTDDDSKQPEYQCVVCGWLI